MAVIAPEAQDNTLEVGEMREAAMWYMTADQREKAKQYIQAAFDYDEQENGAVFSEVEWEDREPHPDGPNPPEREAKMLVGRARLWAIR